MDKQKREKIMLIVVIPIFLLFLIYFLSKNRLGGQPKREVTPGISYENVEDIIKHISIPDKLPEVKYESSRDPLKDLINEYYIKKKEQKNTEGLEKPIVPLPKLNIEGLFWNTDLPQAIVGGKVLSLGDKVEGLKILNISKEGITVEYNGKPELITPKRSLSSNTEQIPYHP